MVPFTWGRGEVLESAKRLTGHLQQITGARGGAELGASVLDTACRRLAARFDEQRGGFSEQIKFPVPRNLTFLLRHWTRRGVCRE
jgi:uncharacterized protein YyaL (SSP411 family)